MVDDFSNAKAFLCDELRSVSGLKIAPEWLVWSEMYGHAFVEKLEAKGFGSPSEFAKLLTRMDGFNNVGEFLYEAEEQEAEMAAYGLLVFDRILRAESAKVDHWSVFAMHQELIECYQFVVRDFFSSVRRNQAVAAGAKGGKARAAKYEPIETWGVREAAKMRGPMSEIARKLALKLPKDLLGISDDPERRIYEALRKNKGTRPDTHG